MNFRNYLLTARDRGLDISDIILEWIATDSNTGENYPSTFLSKIRLEGKICRCLSMDTGSDWYPDSWPWDDLSSLSNSQVISVSRRGTLLKGREVLVTIFEGTY